MGQVCKIERAPPVLVSKTKAGADLAPQRTDDMSTQCRYIVVFRGRETLRASVYVHVFASTYATSFL